MCEFPCRPTIKGSSARRIREGTGDCEASHPAVAQAGRQVRCRPHMFVVEVVKHSMRSYAAQARTPDNGNDGTAAAGCGEWRSGNVIAGERQTSKVGLVGCVVWGVGITRETRARVLPSGLAVFGEQQKVLNGTITQIRTDVSFLFFPRQFLSSRTVSFVFFSPLAWCRLCQTAEDS